MSTSPRVPSRSWYDPVLDAHLHTGEDATTAVVDLLHDQPPYSVPIAIDIETPGLERNFEVNCVTAAWTVDGRTHAILLDPVRNEGDMPAMLTLGDMASEFILHNAAFDTPALVHHSLIDLDQVSKIVDTLVLARFATPDTMVGKKLEQCVQRYLGMADFEGGMALAFKAAGYRTQADGYEGMDIDTPIYRLGAMADTVLTLRLEPQVRQADIDWTTDHPFVDHGAVHADMAAEILAVQETVHRVMLRRSAVGLAVDLDYLDRYEDDVDVERNTYIAELAVHGLQGGSGKAKAMLEYLESRGELPANWPRTKTKQLSATKEQLASFDHPLAVAQRRLAEVDKIMGYLDKVRRQAAVTGRCHPQVGVLGASATGRMSYQSPELQQFSAPARPIITDDGQGLTSIDWSQIEPVTMACMARDEQFLAPFEAGEDLYEPIQRSCGLSMDKAGRDVAKIVLLATMYGQGIAALGRKIGHTEESAGQIRRQMLAAMPRCSKWMSQVQQIADIHGRVITAGGRILPIDPGYGYKAINYVVQGSAYDVLAHTIVEMERQGIGAHLQLAMHDELVVDTEVAEQVQQIMLTPPPFLEHWAGRTPVLRTDRADMGTCWLKV